ncbi:MAG: hypothetical protein ACYDA6_10005 [Solirubrobacteraceae bacterium]
MRTRIAAIVVITVALLVGTPWVRGAIFIVWALALVVAILLAVGRMPRDRASLVPWVVSLLAAGLTTAPTFVTMRYKHLGVHVASSVIGWLLAASLLRLVIFLADHFRGGGPSIRADA